MRGLGVGIAVAMGRLGAVAGPKLGGAWRAAGLDTSQLLMKLLPVVVLVSVVAFLLGVASGKMSSSSRGSH